MVSVMLTNSPEPVVAALSVPVKIVCASNWVLLLHDASLYAVDFGRHHLRRPHLEPERVPDRPLTTSLKGLKLSDAKATFSTPTVPAVRR